MCNGTLELKVNILGLNSADPSWSEEVGNISNKTLEIGFLWKKTKIASAEAGAC